MTKMEDIVAKPTEKHVDPFRAVRQFERFINFSSLDQETAGKHYEPINVKAN